MGNPQRSIQKIWRERKPEIFCGLLCLIAVGALVTILVHRFLYVKSSYATLQAYSIPLSSQVSGEITRVYVNENQAVKKGQILCTIDDRPYLNRLSEAESQRDALIPQIHSAEKDLNRMKFLLKRGAIAPANLDHALANAQSLQAQYESAKALAAIAKVNVSRTQILAPADGNIAFRSAQVGMYASTTTALFGFIASQDRWVGAKIKETDLSGIRVGDQAEIHFDSIPSRKFTGHIESFAQATETPFAAVPDDFSAGNFTKYPQWLPVHIRLDHLENENLPIGINSVVEMKRRRS
jgi:membrane fusion protein (multidrug efflux system)